ncbi:uncharacterized protein E0L32_012037 [Thyridium curvatum]|uniref:Chromo domain-containing protein n=1 Tax=Thyridium curvatum TaxID=1093900 RepID=A0A507BLU0_9PEZI|nr:uncharacterized protein E0L32_012037 [Thyridium curvatum]TPX17658.1 hypothetical protein E0L32_012037 [Thyridium curvatum]
MNRETSTSPDIHSGDKPGPAKSRPPAHIQQRPTSSPEDTWFAIKDIVDERLKKKQLWYKVDWADNIATGEKYEPTWIPAEDANEEAVEDWERVKRRRKLGTQDSSLDSQPVQLPNWRAKRRTDGNIVNSGRNSASGTTGHQRQFEGTRTLSSQETADALRSSPEPQLSHSPDLPAINQGNRIVIELSNPSRLDLSEYVPVTSSQLSEYTASQGLHQPGASCDPQSTQQAVVSQRTIPDSQDFSASEPSAEASSGPRSSEILEAVRYGSQINLSRAQAPGIAVAEAESASDQQQRNSNQESSGSAIPSHQPGGSLSVRGLETTSEDPQASSLPSNTSTTPSGLPRPQPQGLSVEEGELFHFQTQPDFQLNLTPTLEPESDSQRASNTRRTDPAVRNALPAASESATLPEAAAHSAQLIRPLHSQPSEEFQSQYFSGLGLDSSVDHIIPETVHKPRYVSPPQQHSALFPSASIVDSVEKEDYQGEEHRSPRHSPSNSLHPDIEDELRSASPATPELSSMDGTSRNATPRSAVDELREAQALAFARGNTGLGSDQGVESSGEQPIVSPSIAFAGEGEGILGLAAGEVSHPDTHHTWQQDSEMSQAMDINPADISIRQPAADFITPGKVPSGGGDFGIDFASSLQPSTNENLESTNDEHLVSGTIAPSALVTSTEFDAIPITSLPGDDFAGVETVEQAVADMLPGSESPSSDDDQVASLDNLVTPIPAALNEYVITLPLAANLRPQYLEKITDNKRIIEAFTEVFNSDEPKDPEDSLVAGINNVFQSLLDIGDFPAFVDSLPSMSKEEMKKHATGTNSKFSFVYELLDGLRDMPLQVLFLSRPGRIADFIEAIVATEGFKYQRLGDESFLQSEDAGSPLSVIIGSTDADASQLPSEVDLVIGFDQASRVSGLLKLYASDDQFNGAPTVLSLVATHSVEHIDLRISKSLDALERKNALLISTVQSRPLILDPERGYPEPHEAAEIFSRYIRNPTNDFDWEPQPIPDDIFDVYLSSQVPQQATQEQMLRPEQDTTRGTSRKRLLDENDAAEGTPKRARISESADRAGFKSPIHLSEALLAALGGSLSIKGPTVEISVDQLEAMAIKIEQLQTRLQEKDVFEEQLRGKIRSLDSQVKSHEKTARKIQPKYMQALRDRGTFELERDAAVKKAEAAEAKIEAGRATAAKLREDVAALTAKLADANKALASSDNPDLARLAAADEQLRQAVQRAEALERKAASAQTDLDYARSAYQNASNSAADLAAENRELQARARDLEQRASRNLLEVHRVNHAAEVDGLRRLWLEHQAIARERERDLERAREELKLLKNGRRETRATSVPRSPRLGMMSPRTVAGGRAAGLPSSRGTSPVPYDGPGGGGAAAAASGGGGAPPPGMPPGMAYFNQPAGNGRWGHLRD